MEEAQTIGANRLVVLLGGDEVAFGLAHLGSTHADHALSEELLKGLPRQTRSQTDVDHGLHVETGVEQVQDGVFDAADVLIDGHPLGRFRRVKRLAIGKGVSKA